MGALLLLASLLICMLPASAPKNSSESTGFRGAEIQQIETGIKRLGARMIWMRITSGACTRHGLHGVYKPEERTIFLCQQSIRDNTAPLIDILRHEGWHAIQQICNNGRPVMSKDKNFSILTDSDRKNLREFDYRSQYPLEAEARAIEKLSADDYLHDIDRYCTHV